MHVRNVCVVVIMNLTVLLCGLLLVDPCCCLGANRLAHVDTVYVCVKH